MGLASEGRMRFCGGDLTFVRGASSSATAGAGERERTEGKGRIEFPLLEMRDRVKGDCRVLGVAGGEGRCGRESTSCEGARGTWFRLGGGRGKGMEARRGV